MDRLSDISESLSKKRRGEQLTEKEITDFIAMASNKTIADCHIGAMLMAIAIQGMTETETMHLTKAQIHSGHVFEWPIGDTICDKHSTGGAGDKISIPLAPALASLGVKVPMLSGRGLALTGGTLDKLESIPDYRVALTKEELINIIEDCGVFIAAATESICPGDRALYRIRDVTATVDVDELIVASILGKKAAAGVKTLVLDLKVGDVTVYKTVDEASKFALKMKRNAALLGMNLTVFVTEMDNPLGHCVGNSLEIEESLQILKGEGAEDVIELVTVLGGQLLMMCGKASSLDQGRRMIQESLTNGKALKKFSEMLVKQGVKPDVARSLCYEDATKVLPQASKTTPIVAKESGWIAAINAVTIASVIRDLGGNRFTPTDVLDLAAGVVILKARGSPIKKGDTWLTVHHNRDLTAKHVTDLEEALKVTDVQVPANPSRVLKVL